MSDRLSGTEYEERETNGYRVKSQVLTDSRVLKTTSHENSGTVDRTRRDDDSLSSSDQCESSVLVLDESTDAVFPR